MKNAGPLFSSLNFLRGSGVTSALLITLASASAAPLDDVSPPPPTDPSAFYNPPADPKAALESLIRL